MATHKIYKIISSPPEEKLSRGIYIYICEIFYRSWVAKAIIVTETESETEVEEEVDQTPVTSAAYFYQNVNIIFKEIKPKEIDKNEVKNPSFIPQVPEVGIYIYIYIFINLGLFLSIQNELRRWRS